jgi:hypothetical protein
MSTNETLMLLEIAPQHRQVAILRQNAALRKPWAYAGS